MKKLLSLALLISLSTAAMDEQGQRYDDTGLPEVEIHLDRGMMYIGEGADRRNLEITYGKQFNLNAIFLDLRFRNYRHFMKSQSSFLSYRFGTKIPKAPAYISYDDIKDCKEDDTLTLHLHGYDIPVRCRQQYEENPYHKIPFEQMIRDGFDRFKRHANYRYDDEQSLVQAQVLGKKNHLHQREHGPKGYNFARENSNS